MGQQTTGILYGIIEPTDLYTRNDYEKGGRGPGLLDRWETANRSKIKAIGNSGALATYERPESRIVPDEEYCANVGLMGFWVCAGASGKPGSPHMPAALPLSDIESTEPYASAITRAREAWDRFAAWADGQGVKFPPARLYLAECEVA